MSEPSNEPEFVREPPLPPAPKPGEAGSVVLTCFSVRTLSGNPREPEGYYHHEQIANRITIDQHPDGEDQPHQFLTSLANEGALSPGSEYMIIRREWTARYSHDKSIMRHVSVTLFSTRILVSQS